MGKAWESGGKAQGSVLGAFLACSQAHSPPSVLSHHIHHACPNCRAHELPFFKVVFLFVAWALWTVTCAGCVVVHDNLLMIKRC